MYLYLLYLDQNSSVCGLSVFICICQALAIFLSVSAFICWPLYLCYLLGLGLICCRRWREEGSWLMGVEELRAALRRRRFPRPSAVSLRTITRLLVGH